MRQIHAATTALTLAVLLGACAPQQEPLFALFDQNGRTVALAGQSQLGGAPVGTTVRASVGGQERTVVVGGRVGMGPVVANAPPPVAAPVAVAAAAQPIAAPVVAEELPPPSTAAGTTRRARRSGVSAAAAESSGATQTRRRLPPARSVSRSVM